MRDPRMFNLAFLSRQSPRGEGRRNPHVASYGSGQERGTEDHTTIGGIMAGGGRGSARWVKCVPVFGRGGRASLRPERGRGRGSHAVVDWRVMWLGCKGAGSGKAVRGDEREWEEIHILCARAVNARFAFLETALPSCQGRSPGWWCGV